MYKNEHDTVGPCAVVCMGGTKTFMCCSVFHIQDILKKIGKPLSEFWFPGSLHYSYTNLNRLQSFVSYQHTRESIPMENISMYLHNADALYTAVRKLYCLKIIYGTMNNSGLCNLANMENFDLVYM